MGDAVRSVYGHYADFSGRAGRAEYWWFILFMILAVFAFGLVIASVRWFLLPYLLFLLATVIPSWALQVRRLHDTDHSGWWVFISLIPFLGGIWLLILMATAGDDAPNRYGLRPA